jgi:hypothetical protein
MLQLIAWLVLAAIHATPALALFQPAIIARLYRVQPENPLFLLFQHRAALFVVIFLVCIWAAFDPTSRRIASVAVAISMISFLILWWMRGSPPAFRTIALTDLIGLPFLAFVAWKAFTVA